MHSIHLFIKNITRNKEKNLPDVIKSYITLRTIANTIRDCMVVSTSKCMDPLNCN